MRDSSTRFPHLARSGLGRRARMALQMVAVSVRMAAYSSLDTVTPSSNRRAALMRGRDGLDAEDFTSGSAHASARVQRTSGGY